MKKNNSKNCDYIELYLQYIRHFSDYLRLWLYFGYLVLNFNPHWCYGGLPIYRWYTNDGKDFIYLKHEENLIF